jgi:signal transduction histidine kinase/ligand-binding sensor domain-containing protein
MGAVLAPLALIASILAAIRSKPGNYRHSPVRQFLVPTLLAIAGAAAQCAGIPSQYVHTRWSVQDGSSVFPVHALAQTEDGYLWLGSSRGLWRFDGSRFVSWQPRPGERDLPSADIKCLHAARDGGLWVGSAAGIRKLHDGRLEASPLGSDEWARVRTILEDPNHVLWVGMDESPHGGLAKVEGGKVDYYGPADGLAGGVQAIFRDQAGDLWLGTRLGLLRWPLLPGKPSRPVLSSEVLSIAETSNRGLLTAVRAQTSIQSGIDGRFQPLPGLTGVAGTSVLADRAGNVWVGTFNRGLVRARDGQLEWFDTTYGLSDSTVATLLEDRDGNIWVGTPSGLDRFRPALINHIAAKDGLSEDLVTVIDSRDRDGVWVGTSSGGVNRIDPQGLVQKQAVKGLPSTSITSLYEESASRLWVGTLGGLALCDHRACRPFFGPAGETLDRVVGIAGRGGDTIWLMDGRKGLYVVSRGIVKHLDVAGLPSPHGVYGLLADSDALWIGYYQGQVAVLRGSSLKIYTSTDGIAPGPVMAIYRDAMGSVWIGSSGGLSRFRNGVWTAWTTANGLPSAPVYDLIGDRQDGLWFTTPQGLVRLDLVELGSQPDRDPRPFRYLLYGIAAGMEPPVNATWPRPRTARSADGRLWFVTEHGVATIDPRVLQDHGAKAPIVIEKVSVNGHEQEVEVGPLRRLEFRGRDVRFDYTAVSLSSANSIQFRYRLSGFDRDWTQADARRQAFYTNLPPGRYEFQVTATNVEGVSTGASAALPVVILPAFYETLTFRILCVLAAFALLYGLYRLRLTQITVRLRARSEERLLERTRIARELHDTLLQAIVGVSLQLESFASRSAGSDAAQAEIRRIQSHLSGALRDTRRSVSALRATEGGRDLASLLNEQSGTFSGGKRNIQVCTAVDGDAYALGSEIEEELLRIAQGAIANSIAHSQGSRVNVQLIYQPSIVILRISDDGCGISDEALRSGRPGHFGLRGMRERAERIGAKFSIVSRSGEGTTVEAVVKKKGSAWMQVTAFLRSPVWKQSS